MSWNFRKQALDERTRDSILGEFFSTDAIRNPVEALVREGIQNSLDAASGKSIRIRLFLAEGKHAAPADKVSAWFEGAWPHYHAAGNGLREPPKETERCNFLVFEDFGTTGLQGDIEQPYDLPGSKNSFFYFFRAEGRTGKRDLDRGRWGIGKHVFPRSSRLSTIFGLTVRQDDQEQLLMGISVLKSHQLNNDHFSPDGYFGKRYPGKPVQPIKDIAVLNRFRKDFGLKRNSEPGLSIVVPHVDVDFTAADLKEAVVRGYFYPILTGSLSVTVETPDQSVEINAATLVDVALGLEGDCAAEILPMVDFAEWAAGRPADQFVMLKPCKDDKPKWSDDLIPSEELQVLQGKLADREKLAFKAELTIREKNKPPVSSYFNIFLWQDGYENGKPVFIREGIIISDVQEVSRARGIRSLVVIEDKPIAMLLGDSENPAHTQWQRDSSNFKGKYTYGGMYIDFVKRIVASLAHALRLQDEKQDPSILMEIFSLPAPDEKGRERHPKPEIKPKKGVESGEEPGEHEPRKRRFRVTKVAGGFTVSRGETGAKPPSSLDIRVAYDIRRGNPLSKWHPADFQLGTSGVTVADQQGVSIAECKSNQLLVDILDPDFHVTMTGFDQMRDLFVKVKMNEDSHDSQA